MALKCDCNVVPSAADGFCAALSEQRKHGLGITQASSLNSHTEDVKVDIAPLLLPRTQVYI